MIKLLETILFLNFYKINQIKKGGFMKSFAALFVLLIALGFVSQAVAQGFVHGKFDANSSSSGYILHKNQGDRVYTAYVKFEKPFEQVPEILIMVNKLEAHKDSNVRYAVSAEGISRDGFTIRIKTWNDTRLLNIGGNWMAFTE